MTNRITNGDYVLSDKCLAQVEYIDELLQNIRIMLTASRGRFYPDKNFGSRLKDAGFGIQEPYALAYARQALDTLDGVFVKTVEAVGNKLCFTLEINSEERQVTIELENNI